MILKSSKKTKLCIYHVRRKFEFLFNIIFLLKREIRLIYITGIKYVSNWCVMILGKENGICPIIYSMLNKENIIDFQLIKCFYKSRKIFSV